MHSNFNDLNTKTMTAKEYLLEIGFDDSHLPELFNNDDKSYYQITELLEDYHQEQFKILNIPCVTASYFDKIQKGFKKLQEDCTEVSLVGFCQKEDIPDEAHREEFEEEFDHEYQLTQTDGWDEASFWGDIYLQLDGTLYMRFYVHG